jgi:periplasmic protein TonB
MAERQLWMGKEMVCSLVLHALCISAMIIFSTCVTKEPETVRIVLTPDPSGGGGGGGGNVRMAAQANLLSRRSGQGILKERGIRRMERIAYRTPGEDIRQVVDTTPADGVEQRDVSVRPFIRDAPVPLGAGGGGTSPGDEGTGLGGGKGSGTGSGSGSGSGTGVGSGTGTGIGSGSGSSTGRGRGRAESSESPRNRYLREHFEYIRDLILKNLSYPPMAKRLGWSGNVKVSFIIREDGRVEAVKIVETSGYDLLDKNVVETIHEAQPFPRPPVRAELVIPVTYTLKSPHAGGRK